MKKTIISTCAFGALLLSQLALAGEQEKQAAGEKKRCTAETQTCINRMVEQFKGRGWIGIEMEKGDGRQIITKVVSDSPAQRAGLLPGDAILGFDGISVSEGEKVVYAAMKKALVPGRTMTLSIERRGTPRQVDVLLAEVPKQLLAQWVGQHVLDQHVSLPAQAEAPKGE